MNKTTKKCEEGIILSRGTFRDLATDIVSNRIAHALEVSNDPLIGAMFTLEFSMFLGDLEIAIFGKENKNG